MKNVSTITFNCIHPNFAKSNTEKFAVYPVSYISLLMIFCMAVLSQSAWASIQSQTKSAIANIEINSPAIQQASRYKKVDDISAYWVSEKLDGVRARWTGKQLISRNGHPFNAPIWFTADLPPIALDGELWIGRGQFDRVSGIVRQHQPNDKLWQQVKLMLFDLPNNKQSFTQRLSQMQTLVKNLGVAHLQVIPQQRLNSETKLQQLLDSVVKAGAEGLMLHHGQAKYQHQRVAHLLKVKKHQDAEAVVIAHLPGKGKFKGMLGAIKVRDKQGVEFKIGTGFSHDERKNPPLIGSVITFKYFGKTSKNKPRFASFLRVRYEVESRYR